MNVVLDVTIFGLIKEWPSARSGIFRVVERTAMGLRDDPRISLRLSCAESWWNYGRTREFLRHCPSLPESLLLPNDMTSKSMVPLQRLSDRTIDGPRLATIPARVLRRASSKVVRRFSPLPRSALRGQDILHSGFFALPESSRNVRNLRRFITIYDLVPILFPDTVTAHTRDIFKRILASVSADVHCLCISEVTKNDLCNHLSIDPSRVTVTPLAASREIFFPVTEASILAEARDRVGIPRDAKYLLSVNTLQPLKNIARAIQAFAAFVQEARVNDLYFVLVGGRGWDFQQILDTIARCNLATDRVIVAGYVPDAQLAPLYSGALAFIYPSLYEGFGLPPLEAMQCGTPVITGNAAAFQEVVGTSGIMVHPSDQDAISQAIAALYGSDVLRAQLSVAGVERASRYSWDGYLEKVVGAYGAAMGS